MLITSKLPLLHASGINIAKLFTANISVSCQLKAGKIWRQKNGLSKLQTARGPLTDLPDYSFIDGRPTPLSVGQVKRKELQEQLAAQAIKGLDHLNRSKQLMDQIDKI